jgi:hypothetical protein
MCYYYQLFAVRSWAISLVHRLTCSQALDDPNALTDDPQLNHFLTNVMPEAFAKLLESDVSSNLLRGGVNQRNAGVVTCL